MRKLTRFVTAIAAVAALGLMACDDDGPTGPAPGIESVSVTPQQVTMNVGAKAQFSAQVNTVGNASATVTWSSADESVVTIDGQGVATAQGAGTTTVTATATAGNDTKSASASVTVKDTENAELSINSWQAVDPAGQTNDVSNPDSVGSATEHGNERLVVSINVDEGDQSIDQVALTLNDSVVGTQTFTDKQVSMQTGGTATVELSVDSDAVSGALDGHVRRGAFPNGVYNVGAKATLSGGGTVTAETTINIVFANLNQIKITHFDKTGHTAVEQSEGVRFWGGANVVFAATPVLYDEALNISSVTASATAPGMHDDPADISFGNGTTETMDSEPFRFTAADSSFNNTVEDSAAGPGHTFTATDVRNDAGESLIDDFATPSLTDFHLDFRAPQLDTDDGDVFDTDATTEYYVVINPADSIDGGEFYSGGAYQVDDVLDGTFGANVGSQFSAITSAGDTLTAIVGPDSLSELDEPKYQALLTKLYDPLTNVTDLSAFGASAGHGVDKGAPTFSDTLPATDLVLNGEEADAQDDQVDPDSAAFVLFTTTDPILADDSAGSGVVEDSVTAVLENTTKGTTATHMLSSSALSLATTGEFQLDMTSSNGGARLGDGEYTVTITSPDSAFTANEGTHVFNFTLDTTDPFTSLTDPPSRNVTSSQDSLSFTINGRVRDEVGLDSAFVRARQSNDGDDNCELSDPLINSGGTGNAEDDEFNVLADLDSEGNFAVEFTLSNPGSTITQHVCWFVEGADMAKDNQGNPAPNMSNAATHTDINWNQ